MTTVFRSLALAVLLATLGMGAAHAGSEAPAGHYANQKVVYHNGGGPDGAAYFKRLLGNLRNHVDAVGKDHVEIRVVSLGDGLALFQAAAEDKELAGRIQARYGKAEDEAAQHDPVDDERDQAVPGEVAEQKRDRDVADDERERGRDDELSRADRPVAALEVVA